MNRYAMMAAAAMASLAGTGQAATTVVTVNGNDNPFLAGAPDGAVALGDTAPDQSPTLALTGFDTSQSITFAAVGGFDFAGGVPAASADGSFLITMGDALGISGATGVAANGLVGVFLDDSTPGGTAPAKRDDGLSFTTLAPELRQIFWIGDGLTGTGTGTVQTFFAPAGATRLFLGSVDGSGWFNNSGVSTVTINYTALGGPAVPEPAAWALMIGGFGVAGTALRRRASSAAAA
ncbi:PEPxxWA-CTERM sorting domain-containing protein [Sphingomonas sp. 1P06PA]|uniref:PEPxxWA-CTERM sorting domain-containing protein n=1 Tax=Sphingomonas sp. 1P06PA TaxID=554121 RepID=UPI0039A540D3